MAKAIGAVRKGLQTFFGAVFGQVRWTPPAWAERLGQARRNRPRRFWSIIICLLLTPLLVLMAYYAWQMRPQPVLTEITIDAPGITRVDSDGKLYPEPLTLRFSTLYDDARDAGPRSAARLDLIEKQLNSGVTLEPQTAGVWEWIDENTLRFEPTNDWPAGQQYRIRLQPDIFAKGVRLAEDNPRFSTPEIQATLNEITFYQNPEKASEHRVVATLDFTHAVDRGSLSQHLSLSMRASDESINATPKSYPFELTLAKQGRKAHISTAPLELPENENFMALTLAPGVAAVNGPSTTEDTLEARVRVPAVHTYFRVSSVNARILRNEEDNPEQTLIMEFTDGVNTEQVAEHIRMWELPGEKHWRKNDINEQLLARSEEVPLQGNPSEHDFAKLQSFRFQANEGRQLWVQLPAGLTSHGGFEMTVPYGQFFVAPRYPREAQIMGEGTLLALTGAKKLSLQARGIPALRVEAFRLSEEQVNHLVTQTRGNLETANFSNHNFNEENIGQRFERILPLNMEDPGEATYASLDLGDYLSRTGLGLFVVRVQAWDPSTERRIYGADDRRLVLVSDLSIIAKRNVDRSRSLFVHSLSEQKPVAAADIQLLGRNGIPVATATTDATGRAEFSDVSGLESEQQPVVFMVRRGSDVSFLPFERYDRNLNFSRFNTRGVHTGSNEQEQLRALIFSDRGIYRPGESGHLGIMVKHQEWEPVTGVPVELTLTDPRNKVVLRERVALTADGFIEQPINFATTDATGQYQAHVYLLGDDEHYRRQLGHTTLSVEEFQPDTMRIQASIEGEQTNGWRRPLEYQAKVALQNLFGLPAQGRRVEASYHLTPTQFGFSQYPGYRFGDPYRDREDRLKRGVTEPLPAQESDEAGEALFDIDLSRYGNGLYRLTLNAEGYETGGGRSVSARNSTLVSPAAYLVGWKTDGELGYLQRNSERNVNLIAINPKLESIPLQDLQLKIIEQRRVSTLVRQPNGTLAYNTVIKEEPVSKTVLNIQEDGTLWRVPTEQPGDFAAAIVNSEGILLAQVEFRVVGAQNIGGDMEKNAELNVRLDKTDYQAGEEIELQITAPYTGAGLITIEQDKVYTHKWFHTDTTRSIQRIRLPQSLEGNGYVNVTFVRSLDSDEIFTQPLSYAVTPFNIDRSARSIDIDLQVPERVKPGEELTINFQASEPARMALFAVDEGILQVANYQTPQPLDSFLQKRALEVVTAQMADLLMPEFRFLREAAGVGGDAAFQSRAKETLGSNLNPFQRNVRAPVAYWSGIVDATGESQSLSFTVPDYFDGQLRIMAVASTAEAAGSTSDNTLVRGPFVLQPNVITTAAPGDVFEVSVGVTNALDETADESEIQVHIEPSEHLSIVGAAKGSLTLQPGKEGRVSFQVEANSHVGAAELVFRAEAGDQRVTRTATLSVRPAVPHRATLDAGIGGNGNGELVLERNLLPVLAGQQAALGYSPLVLAGGLQTWLESYPHNSTEQLISRSFSTLSLLNNPAAELDREATLELYQHVVAQLQARQQPDGGFGFWPGHSYIHHFVSSYAMHFLTDAAEQDAVVPADMLSTGLDYLRRQAAARPQQERAYEQAYAIYVLTRNGMVTTNYLTQLQEYLNKHQANAWHNELTAAYMAASYKLLRLEDLAQQLIRDYQFAEPGSDFESDMDSALARNAQYVYLLARHFPERLERMTDAPLQAMVTAIAEGRFNTLSSAYTVLALGAWGTQSADAADGQLEISARLTDGAPLEPLATGHPPMLTAELPLTAKELSFSGNSQRIFYTATQSGYDAELPTKTIERGLEITREYLDESGQPVTSATQGDQLTIRLRLRALDNRRHDNIAVVDLLPGGFEIERESVRRGQDWSTDYIDIREDRLVLYGSLTSAVRTFRYNVKVTAAGTFIIPPAFAESMYHPDLQAQSLSREFEVHRP